MLVLCWGQPWCGPSTADCGGRVGSGSQDIMSRSTIGEGVLVEDNVACGEQWLPYCCSDSSQESAGRQGMPGFT